MRTLYTKIVHAFLLITAGCVHNDFDSQLERDLATGAFSCRSRTTYLANGQEYKTQVEACRAAGCSAGCYFTLMCGQNKVVCAPNSDDLDAIFKTPEQLGRERAEEEYR